MANVTSPCRSACWANELRTRQPRPDSFLIGIGSEAASARADAHRADWAATARTFAYITARPNVRLFRIELFVFVLLCFVFFSRCVKLSDLPSLWERNTYDDLITLSSGEKRKIQQKIQQSRKNVRDPLFSVAARYNVFDLSSRGGSRFSSSLGTVREIACRLFSFFSFAGLRPDELAERERERSGSRPLNAPRDKRPKQTIMRFSDALTGIER